jgi:hypothetical protein
MSLEIILACNFIKFRTNVYEGVNVCLVIESTVVLYFSSICIIAVQIPFSFLFFILFQDIWILLLNWG